MVYKLYYLVTKDEHGFKVLKKLDRGPYRAYGYSAYLSVSPFMSFSPMFVWLSSSCTLIARYGVPEIHDLTGKKWRDECGKAQRQCERHDIISTVPVIFGNLYGLPKSGGR